MSDAESRSQAAVTTAAADWPDVERLFGIRGEPSRCWCRFFAVTGTQWSESTPEQRKAQLRDKFDGDAPPPGVLAFRGGTPVGWCAVEPRGCYPRILRSKVLAAAPEAVRDPDANQVWAVSCFVVAPGQRRTGVARALLTAAVGHALANGAKAVEGYPVDPAQRPKAAPADLYHGTLGLFLAAGFDVVSAAVPGRAVVRLTASPAGTGTPSSA
ncbi:GNAT family N-acetyltransferase [Arthrobacter sp. NicSoilB8]|uniref:GNAT family N-acetyltransferase n=1 Tax=Arthrobacter sp. NicSoilB8 TaxID=2830998 RepID=UPI001CC65C2F|nr:GNAT family N-acetyltransferase [Arthrobacter sp. NicSoilB8]BCW71715.1 N-acetyltransferase [Arthrobacter sp. NicSoilB8]